MPSASLNKAISALAELKDGWALMADTMPDAFIAEVREEILTLRAERDLLKKQMRFWSEHGQELRNGAHRLGEAMGEDFPAGDKDLEGVADRAIAKLQGTTDKLED